MMALNNITIKARMIFSFALIVFLFIVFGVISVNQLGVLGKLTTRLYNHPLQVSTAALKAKVGIISMHRSMKDVSTSPTQFAANMAIQAVQSEEKKVYQELSTVKALIIGEEGKKLVEETMEMFSGWKPIRTKVEELILAGDSVAANKITREEGADYVVRLERKILSLTSHAFNKADEFMNNARIVEKTILRNIVFFIAVLILIAVIIGFFMSSSILSSMSYLTGTMKKITETGDFTKAELIGNNEITDMSEHFNGLIEKLKDQFWFSEGQNRLNRELSGDFNYDEILVKSIEVISRYVDACAGALYQYNKNEEVCELKSSYAFVKGKQLSKKFKLGEGIVGQVAMEKKPILLTNINIQDAVMHSGTMSKAFGSILAVPLFYKKKLYGVFEVACLEEIKGIKKEFLINAANIISVILHTTSQSDQIKQFLKTSRKANERLQAQTQELQAQTEELQAMNEEFQQQSDELKEQNIELEAQRLQVEEANRLKSEFLSNMSHELRTPLNSVNALSRVLILQARQKLSDEEVNYLEIIERNGKHLLSLINDILDLSKIEAGRMDISLNKFSIKTLIENIMESIEPLAREKNLKLEQQFSKNLVKIESDESRVFQILQNIIANAVKFTDKGHVMISVEQDEDKVRIRVKDTGIGILDADIGTVFDEFRQVDGASTRKFEGTGLGLAIAYKAATMLGGDIRVKSSKGLGSTFVITLPIVYDGPKKRLDAFENNISNSENTADTQDDKTILIVDDDPKVLKMISQAFSDQGYHTLTTTSGKEAIKLAEHHHPFAITLDVVMPEMDGWEVLGRLKKNPATSSIPVIIVSVSNDKDTGFALGAVGCVTKPVDRRSLIHEINKIYGYLPSSVMVVDDSDIDRQQTAQIIMSEGMKVQFSNGGRNCLAMLKTSQPDVLVLDLVMPDMDGFEVLENIRKTPLTSNLPVIIVTAKDLSYAEKQKLENHVSSILLKSDTTSTELMEQIMIILHKIGKKGLVLNTPQSLEKNRILLVEDNEAAVIQVKKALEIIGVPVDVAEDGQKALEYIRHTIPQGIILDLMMPNIDGFQVLETIRGTRETKDIPVLILTAKDLTKQDLNRLSSNNVQQLIQKGDVDRQGLLHKVKSMLDNFSEPLIVKEEKRITESSPPGIKGDTPSILVVEDNPDNMTTIKAVIGKDNTIVEAVDGEQGLQTAIELIPDLILLDMALPKIDGLTVVKELKNNERTRHIPVIALTAQAMKGDKEKMIGSGCNDYIAKPIDPDIVMEKLKKWL